MEEELTTDGKGSTALRTTNAEDLILIDTNSDIIDFEKDKNVLYKELLEGKIRTKIIINKNLIIKIELYDNYIKLHMIDGKKIRKNFPSQRQGLLWLRDMGLVKQSHAVNYGRRL